MSRDTSLIAERNHSDYITINFVLFFGACVYVMCDLDCLPVLMFIHVFNCVYVYVSMSTHVYLWVPVRAQKCPWSWSNSYL